ncbi:MAG: UDP-N-acetylmuramoyl-tripeptide--D-alanyl-D-alanine ligase [Candidatus Eisenbacteria bacterium]|nr:UDP-N-acetylmuramoyl-tripeptide--D-alanyl-D-alanine ligase [Candidatus Eisenbacteria bacterium]
MVTGVSTDSRAVGAGEVFFAVRGERFDGHAFVGDAFARGAVAAVVSETAATKSISGRTLVVRDTVSALGDLAAWYRRRFALDVVGVTGTNGKTTTKDMCAAVLATTRRTLRTEGNLNSQIGVPLTLLGLERAHEAAVVEMGMDRPGQIARLAAIAGPRVGVITNVSEAHLETAGSVEEIARGKAEMLDALPGDGTAVLNGDDTRVMSQAGRARCRVITFGLGEKADVRATDVAESDRGVRFRLRGGPTVTVPVPGRHNALNALAAIAVGEALGVPADRAAEALSRFRPTPRRMSVSRVGRWTVIDDSYNCNPESLRAALETLVAVAAGRPTAAVLGDMLELGPRSAAAHEDAGRLVAGLGIGVLYAVGREMQAARAGAIAAGMSPDRARHFTDRRALVDALREGAEGGSLVVLVKGSRGMRMEEVVELLTTETKVS